MLEAPVAGQNPHTLAQHGDARSDDYYWLRDDDRADRAVLAHLAAENAYAKAVLADTEAVQDRLYHEMRGRIQEADESVPVRDGPYMYYSRTLEGAQYSVHCRRPLSPDALARKPSGGWLAWGSGCQRGEGGAGSDACAGSRQGTRVAPRQAVCMWASPRLVAAMGVSVSAGLVPMSGRVHRPCPPTALHQKRTSWMWRCRSRCCWTRTRKPSTTNFTWSAGLRCRQTTSAHACMWGEGGGGGVETAPSVSWRMELKKER